MALQLCAVSRSLEMCIKIDPGPFGARPAPARDNKGAYDLCHRTTTGKNSRHVERKVWKMRELHALDVVKLVLVPTEVPLKRIDTEDMCADMLSLSRWTTRRFTNIARSA